MKKYMKKFTILKYFLLLIILMLYNSCNNYEPFEIPELLDIVPQIPHHKKIEIDCISKDLQFRATAGGSEIIIWDYQMKKILKHFIIPYLSYNNKIINLEFAKNNEELYIFTNNNRKFTFSTRNSEIIKTETLDETQNINKQKYLISEENNPLARIITNVSISQNKKYLLMLGSDNILNIWDIFSIKNITSIKLDNPNTTILDIQFNYNLDRIWLIDNLGTFYEWDIYNITKPILNKKVRLFKDKSNVLKASISYTGNNIVIVKANQSEEYPISHYKNSNNAFKLHSQSILYYIPSTIAINFDGLLIAMSSSKEKENKIIVLDDSLSNIQSSFNLYNKASLIEFTYENDLLITYENPPYMNKYSIIDSQFEELDLDIQYPPISFTYCDNVVVITNAYGEVYIYNLLNNQNTFRLLFFDDTDFIFYCGDYLFTTSNINKVEAVKSLKIVPKENILKYIKPKLIKGRLIELFGNISG